MTRTPTPSMDEDRITKVKVPSPPTRTIEQYEANKAKGINSIYHLVPDGRDAKE